MGNLLGGRFLNQLKFMVGLEGKTVIRKSWVSSA